MDTEHWKQAMEVSCKKPKTVYPPYLFIIYNKYKIINKVTLHIFILRV